ncbi:hypothetical protein INT47_006683 [Mucor saturninus]|uniref:Uncharacterized protein n=1 Tax=Mucor saturninus TaxID=64648 RepID=A0A8H7QST7_9FUNG|nr:hypothetical protein INT47_006683 [Mucor saturninus]
MPYSFKRELYPNIKEDDGHFPEMVTATIVSSVISIVATIAIIAAYIYVRLNNPGKADRVSLRCVFLSSLMNLINSIFDICTILKDGDTAFCRATSIITLFTRIMGVIFLTLVGINLILVFVFKVKTNVRELESIYYCVAVLYGLVTISVPISLQSHEKADEIVKNYRCYYYIYYDQFFDHTSFLWTWFYSFLFFAIFAAALCSVIASLKLIREQRIITDTNSGPLHLQLYMHDRAEIVLAVKLVRRRSPKYLPLTTLAQSLRNPNAEFL